MRYLIATFWCALGFVYGIALVSVLIGAVFGGEQVNLLDDCVQVTLTRVICQ